MNSPKEVAKNYVNIGIGKVNLPEPKMFVLGIMAGLFIAFAGVLCTTAPSTIETASLAKLVSGLVFPGGLFMVLVAGSELFTGNCLLVVPLLEKKITASKMIKSWVIVYIGNFVGACLVGFLESYGHLGGLFGGALATAIVNTGVAKVSMSFSDALIRGILCNTLVCIGVWMSFAAKSVGGKLAAAFFPVTYFVACGFEHSIANMYFISAGLFTSSAFGMDAPGLTWGAFFLKNLLPVTLGNMIGGCGVGLAYWYIYLKED